jgi:hypothetical protein
MNITMMGTVMYLHDVGAVHGFSTLKTEEYKRCIDRQLKGFDTTSMFVITNNYQSEARKRLEVLGLKPHKFGNSNLLFHHATVEEYKEACKKLEEECVEEKPKKKRASRSKALTTPPLAVPPLPAYVLPEGF